MTAASTSVSPGRFPSVLHDRPRHAALPAVPRPPAPALPWALVALALGAALAGPAAAQPRDQLPPWPHDLSPAGLRAAASQSAAPADFAPFLPEGALEAARGFLAETRALGLPKRSGRLPLGVPGPPNTMANDPTGDRVGETQAEVAIAVHGDTLVVGWNDSKGFLAGNTVSGFGYSTDGGATFRDGGSVPLARPSDQAFGDPGVDTDERGNWYYNQIYTRTGPTQQNIGVHHGRFDGSGTLVWDPPVQAAIGTSATGNLDKCLLACDRVTGNVYTAYTRFTAVPQIEIVRSTTLGASWDPPIVLDATNVPTASKQSARPFCGPDGEVYVVWEKGANVIFCPEAGGFVPNTTGQIAFTRSLDFGASYEPFRAIGTVEHSWTWSGPGDLRERGNQFPDIAVDRSGLARDGHIYVTWHESAPWTAQLSPGPPRAEAADAANNNPGGAEFFAVGEDVTGTISSSTDFDYWRFSAVQGQSLLFNLDPGGFVCGVANAGNGMRLRLFATQSPYPNPTGFPDSLLAASSLGAFAQRIVWTAPRTGDYLVRLQRSAGAATFGYTLRVRNLSFGSPSPGRDGRDVVVVRSEDRGLTWSSEDRVNDDPPGLENRRPFVAVDGLGHVHLFWHDSRDPGLGANAALTTIYGTTSRDGGLTWTPNFPVTDEPSFFSFNTLAIPNLGDYNQAASWGGVTWPAWSDQRLSSGDVRAPGTNTFTAGRGPDAFTAAVSFDLAVNCPANVSAPAGTTVRVPFTIVNAGSVPDQYDYTVTDTENMIGGPISGSTGVLPPGGTATVEVGVTSPSCVKVIDVVTLEATPRGDPDGARSCATQVHFEFRSFTITASAGPGGAISPSGAVAVECGADQTFTITPDPGYVILDVVVDGVSVGRVPTYTFTTVTADHTITCAFKVPLEAPPYEEDKWNDGPGNPPVPDNKQGKNNCYRYAVNQKTVTGGFARPGRKGGNNPPPPGTKAAPRAGYDCAAFSAAAKADSLENSTAAAACKNGYKVALVVGFVQDGPDVVQDYHWYRQDSNGKWSHKPGGDPATNKDSGNNDIGNPETADKGKTTDGTKQYDNFCGYFCVKKSTEVKLRGGAGDLPPEARRGLLELLDDDGAPPRAAAAAGASPRIAASPISRSGEEDTTLVFTSTADLDSIAGRLTGLAPAADPMWPSRLGYAGFRLDVENVPSLGTRRVRVWDGVVRSDEDSTRSYEVDSEGLEKWLLARFYGDRFVSVPGAGPGRRPAELAPPWPNPFGRSLTIPFSLDAAVNVEVRIYDVSGRMVRRLAPGALASGRHAIDWDGRDQSGGALRAGTYFYRVAIDGRVVGFRKAVFLGP